MSRARFITAARIEFFAEVIYYNEAQPGLGERFNAAVEEAAALAFIAEYERVLELLCTHPELGALWRNRRRRFPVRKFPYSLVYYIHGEEIRVIALAHHRRKPGYWAARK